MPPAIQLQNLQFSWHLQQAPVIDIEEWQVAKGEKVFLYGPSGSGKSTLLNLLAGVLTPVSGKIHILDQDLTHLSSRKKDKFRAKNLGLVFQQFNLLPYLSVTENIKLAQYFSPGQDKQLLAEISQKLGLSALLEQKAGDLSIGQQQRVAIARALVNQPQILIADEPTSALDTALRNDFIQLLLSVTQDTTVVFVSHDQALAEHFDRQQALADINQRS